MDSARAARTYVWYRWLVFCLLAVAYLLVYFHRLSPAVVALDMMKDLSAGAAIMGLLGSAYFYPYALMQIPAGLLSDSWGPRRTITLSFILAGVASIIFGMSKNVGMAIFARVLVGLGVSMLFVPTMKVLTQWFKRREFAMMTAVLMTVGGLGVMVASAPLAYLSQLVGWRGSFIGIGVITLALAAAIWFLVRNSPQELGMPPAEEIPAGPGGGQVEAISLKEGMKMVLSRPSFWALAAWFFFTCGIFFTFGGLWGGPYLTHVYGLSKTQTGNVLSMLALAMIFGSPFLGYLSDRVIHSRKKVLVATSVVILILTSALAFRPAGFSLPMMYVFCFLLSLCASAVVVVGFTMCKELFPTRIAGTSVGMINFFPFLGGAVMQPVFGWILEKQAASGGQYTADDYGRAFLIFLGAAVIGFIAACLTEETIKK